MIRVGVPEVEGRVADLGVGAGHGGRAGPGIVGGFGDEVLKLVQGLDGDADDAVLQFVQGLGGAADDLVLGGRAEVGPDVGAGPADAVVALLAGESSLVGGVPQRAVGGFDVEAGRDDRGEPAGEQRGQVIEVHGGDYGGWGEADGAERGSERVNDEDRPAQTPRYRRVVDGSAELAREMGHSYIGVEHLFLAIIRDRAAVPTQALAELADLDRVEAGLLEVMGSPGYAGQAPADAVSFPRSELRERLAALRDSMSAGARYGWNVAGDRAWIVVDESP